MPSIEDHWHIACLSRELGSAPLAVTLFQRRIALFRDDRGAPAALEDRCVHRGAPLTDGCVENGRIACPYHGWQYASDGRVAIIPSMPPQCSVPPHLRANAYSTIEQDGFVWITLGNPPESTPRRFPLLGQSGWRTFVMKTRFRAPVESCLENFLDCPHATTVHRSWFRTPTARVIKTLVRTLPDGAEAEYFDEPREKSLVWTLLAPSSTYKMRHTDRFIAPSTSQVDYQFTNEARYLITSRCSAIDETTTDVYTVITFRFGWLTPIIHLFFEPLARRIIRQDVDMLNRVEENTTRFGKPRFQVIAQDLLLPHIVQWRNALRNNTPPPEAGRETYVDMRL